MYAVKVRRDVEEYRRRRQPLGNVLTLMCEAWEQTGLDTLVVHAVNDVDLGVEL